jgi:hypothetical protein
MIDAVKARAYTIFAAVCFSTSAYAQNAAPKVGNKPLVQVKPKEPIGCKLVGTVIRMNLLLRMVRRSSMLPTLSRAPFLQLFSV